MRNRVVQELLGSIGKIEPITPEQVERLSDGELTYQELDEFLSQFGLSVQNIICDPERRILNTYYADYAKGIYKELSLRLNLLKNQISGFKRLSWFAKYGNPYLQMEQWAAFYSDSVPVALEIYDFQKRVYDIDPSVVYSVWEKIYVDVSYSNGQWKQEVLEYVFSKAPKLTKLPPEENGLITVYRGMGSHSQPAERAISWSLAPESALAFAKKEGTALVEGKVSGKDVVSIRYGYYNENEVIVKPGSVCQIKYEDMFPANRKNFMKMVVPALPDFIRLCRHAERLGYRRESLFQAYGAGHILRVLLLSLIYYYGSGDDLTAEDKNILCFFSLLHDIGRIDDTEDKGHGERSVYMIQHQNLQIRNMDLSKKAWKIVTLIIWNHCYDDAVGLRAIHDQTNFSWKDKERAGKLCRICKDMDALDRVRFNGLDHRRLRTDFAKKLPLIANCLHEQDIFQILEGINKIQEGNEHGKQTDAGK